MSFITGMLIIDVPAAALNNSGESIQNARTENTSAVKAIRTARGTYPYVTAQAVRYWLRNTLESAADGQAAWQSSPVYREEKVAYTDANPILYWDDDLLGYMRAPSKRNKAGKDDPAFAALTPMEEDAKGNPKPVTRAAPLRVSTFVSIAPVNITQDFGVMARQDGDPAPYEHEFYRATLHGLFSLDLGMAGKFTHRRRTGFQNLDAVRIRQAQEQGLEALPGESAYRLPQAERIRRVQALLLGLARLQGGAKQTLHYTDVTPAVTVVGFTRGGNHPFNYLFSEKNGAPRFNEEVFVKAVMDARADLVEGSPVIIGWKHGYLPEERAKAEQLRVEGVTVWFGTPREAFGWAANWLGENANAWDR